MWYVVTWPVSPAERYPGCESTVERAGLFPSEGEALRWAEENLDRRRPYQARLVGDPVTGPCNHPPRQPVVAAT